MMPSWYLFSTLFKGICILLLVVIIVLYNVPLSQVKRWEIVSAFTATRLPSEVKDVRPLHSPLLKAFVTVTKTSSNSTQASLNSSVLEETEQTAVINLNPTNTSFVPSGDNATTLPPCPEIVPNLRGKIVPVISPVPNLEELERRFSWLKPGGHWYPDTCKVQNKIAIIVPLRCRRRHLILFLQHMHPFLKRQQLDYRIFIIEQDADLMFNRAMLMNIGFVEALKRDAYDCFIFHDVDLLPEDDRNLYTCPTQPRHMSAAVDIFQYKLPYVTIFGGVSAITREHFKLLNGFSNSFWGWGGEDDDMSNRIRYHNLHISRYPLTIARYTMLKHAKDQPSKNRLEIIKTGKGRFNTDGLNSLRYKYSIEQMKENLLYTWLLVELNPPDQWIGYIQN